MSSVGPALLPTLFLCQAVQGIVILQPDPAWHVWQEVQTCGNCSAAEAGGEMGLERPNKEELPAAAGPRGLAAADCQIGGAVAVPVAHTGCSAACTMSTLRPGGSHRRKCSCIPLHCVEREGPRLLTVRSVALLLSQVVIPMAALPAQQF